MIYRQTLKSLVPPIILDLFRHLNQKKSVRFLGAYSDWETAVKDSKGYDSKAILQQAVAKTQLVVSGKVAYERDGVVFKKPEYPYPLLAILLRATSENNNKLTVLDFGGSLGSTYHQCRSFLQGVLSLKWCVVEQSHFVSAGRANFTDKVLSFHNSIVDCLEGNPPNVVLFSGVLQYLPEPFAVLQQVIKSNVDYIVIDRNPFLVKGGAVLSIQKVPKSIIETSYPVWLFNEQEFKQVFAEKYAEIATFDAIDGTIGQGCLTAKFKGIIFKRIEEK